jgi:hypothetical protein
MLNRVLALQQCLKCLKWFFTTFAGHVAGKTACHHNRCESCACLATALVPFIKAHAKVLGRGMVASNVIKAGNVWHVGNFLVSATVTLKMSINVPGGVELLCACMFATAGRCSRLVVRVAGRAGELIYLAPVYFGPVPSGFMFVN